MVSLLLRMQHLNSLKRVYPLQLLVSDLARSENAYTDRLSW
jgi:hypothetical protein